MDVALAEQVRDAVGEHPGLAGAGAGHDEQRGAGVHDGRALLLVQPLEQRRGVDGGRGRAVAVVRVPAPAARRTARRTGRPGPAPARARPRAAAGARPRGRGGPEVRQEAVVKEAAHRPPSLGPPHRQTRRHPENCRHPATGPRPRVSSAIRSPGGRAPSGTPSRPRSRPTGLAVRRSATAGSTTAVADIQIDSDPEAEAVVRGVFRTQGHKNVSGISNISLHSGPHSWLACSRRPPDPAPANLAGPRGLRRVRPAPLRHPEPGTHRPGVNRSNSARWGTDRRASLPNSRPNPTANPVGGSMEGVASLGVAPQAASRWLRA